jgi:hypothetical protein
MDLVPANPPLPPAEAAHASELVLPATSPQARKRADGAKLDRAEVRHHGSRLLTSKKRVFVDVSGRFWGLMLEKAVHCLGFLHYGWAWNLASKMDGTSSEAKPTALGYVFVPWFSTGKNSARDFR